VRPRASGALGFPSNVALTSRSTTTFHVVLFRFAILTPETFPRWNGSVQKGIEHVLTKMEVDRKEWQLGRTKIFIKSPETVRCLATLSAMVACINEWPVVSFR